MAHLFDKLSKEHQKSAYLALEKLNAYQEDVATMKATLQSLKNKLEANPADGVYQDIKSQLQEMAHQCNQMLLKIFHHMHDFPKNTQDCFELAIKEHQTEAFQTLLSLKQMINAKEEFEEIYCKHHRLPYLRPDLKPYFLALKNVALDIKALMNQKTDYIKRLSYCLTLHALKELGDEISLKEHALDRKMDALPALSHENDLFIVFKYIEDFHQDLAESLSSGYLSTILSQAFADQKKRIESSMLNSKSHFFAASKETQNQGSANEGSYIGSYTPH